MITSQLSTAWILEEGGRPQKLILKNFTFSANNKMYHGQYSMRLLALGPQHTNMNALVLSGYTGSTSKCIPITGRIHTELKNIL